MISNHQIYNEGKRRLMDAGHSDQTALLLMNEICSHYGINLYMEMDDPINPAVQIDFLEAVHEMEKGTPLAYVLGYENFYGYDFIVNENVLIPRPETEELVGLVLQLCDEYFEDQDHVSVFDVATGSGAIGVSLALEEPKMDVIASDISKEALQVAYLNNQKLNSSAIFVCGDMLEPFIERNLHCNILVCNPPYIPSEEEMEHSVVDFEPHVALFGGKDGLKFYRSLLKNAHKVLLPGSIMAFEMGYDQAKRLSQLVREYFAEAKIQVHKDMSGKDRMLSAWIKDPKSNTDSEPYSESE